MPRITLPRTLTILTSQPLTSLPQMEARIGQPLSSTPLNVACLPAPCLASQSPYSLVCFSLQPCCYWPADFSLIPAPPPPPQPCFTPLTHTRDAIWGLFHSASCTSSSGRLALPVPALTHHISARKGHDSTLSVA